MQAASIEGGGSRECKESKTDGGETTESMQGGGAPLRYRLQMATITYEREVARWRVKLENGWWRSDVNAATAGTLLFQKGGDVGSVVKATVLG